MDTALSTLAPEFRAAVVLRDLCDLDYAEIGEVLGIPPGTVRSRIARGRAALAEAFGREPARTRRASNGGAMTPIPDDEVVNAVLDGEATAADAARVAADPALAARLEELRAVRRAVGAPVRPSAEARRAGDRRCASGVARDGGHPRWRECGRLRCGRLRAAGSDAAGSPAPGVGVGRLRRRRHSGPAATHPAAPGPPAPVARARGCGRRRSPPPSGSPSP